MTSAPQVGEKPKSTSTRRRYVPAIGPRLHRLLIVVFTLFALLGVNSVYLSSITILEWATEQTYQNYFYQFMFLAHLILGVAIVLPVIIFGLTHIANTKHRSNKRAMRVGYGLFATSLILLASGIVLTRVELLGFKLAINHPQTRTISYWAHVITPLVAVWLFILHRLAGKRLKWKIGVAWGAASCAFALAMVAMHSQDPRKWNVAGPASGEQYFFPSLARTADGNFIPERTLNNDAYCKDCHPDVHDSWSRSMHKFASFNNPAYLFSVLNTRKALYKRDGNARGSRFCAGCHDVVPFFSGAFDDPKFDDPNYDLAGDSMAQAGITCTACHAITHVNTVRGNADYTIEEPTHYPFAFSDNTLLKWVNRQLIKAKPEFHKKTFLKEFHKSPEFCGTCHKVHLPVELNAYKFLRGQNHYDAYHLSGVSGHGVTSFYYPETAEQNCNGCHMPLDISDDFAAKDFDDTGTLTVHNHQFPSANTAIPYLLNLPDDVITAHRKFNDGVMRVDIFGIKKGGTIDSPLTAPIRPEIPTLQPGQTYLFETIIRTVKMGHLFTQGTADSNEVWMDVTVKSGDRVIGRSGGMRDNDNTVDPWSHFVNAYVIDRDGNRIDRRNAENIFIALYNNQIPPGAADVIHYKLTVPPHVTQPITVTVKLQYRKFDTIYMKHFQGDEFNTNDLPIMTLAVDSVTFPIANQNHTVSNEKSPIIPWQRWNDYGIGLLRKGNSGANRGELRQAEHAFTTVENLNRPDGPLNRARVYLKEGRLEDAVTALARATQFDPPAPPWSVAWFTGLVNKQNGFIDEAINNFRTIVSIDTAETRERGFDFSQDYRLLNELGQTIFERAKQERGPSSKPAREKLLREAVAWFKQSLSFDPENVTAHHNLGLLYAQLDNHEQANIHRNLHAKYKPDDNARDRAINLARTKSQAANHAADAIVIHDLQRPNACELPPFEKEIARK